MKFSFIHHDRHHIIFIILFSFGALLFYDNNDSMLQIQNSRYVCSPFKVVSSISATLPIKSKFITTIRREEMLTRTMQ